MVIFHPAYNAWIAERAHTYDPSAARARLERAWATLAAGGGGWANSEVHRIDALTCHALGETDDAREHMRRSLEHARERGLACCELHTLLDAHAHAHVPGPEWSLDAIRACFARIEYNDSMPVLRRAHTLLR